MDMTKTVTRLYPSFHPSNYKLHIIPDQDAMTFTGSVVITGKKLHRPNQRLTFHQNGLKITEAHITRHDKKGVEEIAVDRINHHATYDEVRLHATKMLYPGEYTVRLEFSGKITKPMNGLYPCFYEHDGKQKKLLATQFESHHAREVFPCIDEPEAKATFDLSLTTIQGEQVIANTPIKKQSEKDGQLHTDFETTPIMSTYLLAFVTGELHYVEGQTKSGVTVRTWGTVAQPKHFMEYSRDEAVKILEFFEGYYQTPFPLPKLDQVALPDFESGAMENWGLVTFREIALLTDSKNRSLTSEQYVSLVVAHELSHMWFGDLVTMKWWEDLWLNESFASLMEHVALDALHPEWHQWEEYAASDLISSSNRDIYSSVQPVRVAVNHPDEIHTLFDPAIVYAKGGRLIKMMHDYIGEDAFREGLKTYFTKYAYKNTTRDDLWAEMSAASGKDINALMDPWLEQSGMPVLRVTPKSANTRTVSQSRFALDTDTDTSTWPIPLLPSSPTTPDILDGLSAEIEFSGDLPILNVHGSGHYVTHYTSDDDLAKIINGVTSGSAPSQARINILNDLMLLARRGDDSLVDALKLVRQLKDEPRDAVWALMARAIGLAANLGEGNKDVKEGIKQFKHELAHKHYQTLGWIDKKDDGPNTKHLRATMIGLMLGAEDPDTISHALKIYKDTPLEDIPADRRGAVLGAVVRHGKDPADITKLIELYKTTSNPDLQHVLCGALTLTKDTAVVQRLIDDGFGTNGYIRPQDSFRWFAYLMRNHYSREQAWTWLTSNWDYVSKEIGDKSLDHWIVYSSSPLQTKEWEARFHKFFESKRKITVIGRNIEIAYAEIAARVAWRDRDLKAIKAFFKKTA